MNADPGHNATTTDQAGVSNLADLAWIDQRASDFEREWRAGQAPRIEHYAAEAPPDLRTALTQELLLVEWELRRPDRPAPQEFARRFPDLEAWINLALRSSVDESHALAATSVALGSEALSPEHPPDVPRLANYEILNLIGRGGMGVVYLGSKRDRVEDHRLVIKMLRHAATPELSDRFRAEMATMARLQHPHIVPILDSGHDRAAGLYFVMPFYPAGDLATALAASGPLAPPTAAEYALAIAWALAYLHERGIVHRDLKARNILLDDYRDGRFPLGRPWLTDFGLVKLLGNHEAPPERNRLTGTVMSMSPEQARGHNDSVGPASDIWSLGVLLYELLTKRTPFRGDSVDIIRYQILKAEPPPLRALRPSVPRDLERIVSKCLEKDPKSRYQSANALIADLTAFLKSEPPLHALPQRLPERVERWARRKPALAIRWGVIAGLIANIWINRGAELLGWKNAPRPDATPWVGPMHDFMEFWFDQLLLVVWAALSWCLQRRIDNHGPTRPVRMLWLAIDALIVTAILWNVEALHSPLPIAYAALIVASGLWQDLALVVATTAFSALGYLALVAIGAAQGDAAPLYEVMHVLTALAALGILVTYHLRRWRGMERLYQQPPTL